MNFFTTFLSICKGLKTFPDLTQRSLWRVIWHAIIMLALAATLIVIGKYPNTENNFEVSKKLIIQEFGELKVSPNGGICVSKSPELARELNLPGNAVISYIPEVTPKELPKIDLNNTQSGFIFSPKSVIVWIGGSSAQMIEMPHSSTKSLELIPYSEEALRAILDRKTPENSVDQPMAQALINMFDHPKKFIIMILGSMAFMEVIWQTLPVVVLFSLIFGWFGSFRTAKLLSVKETFIITVYAGFPALAIASLFPAFELPLLDFNLVFTVGTVIYSVIASNYVVMTKLARSSAGNPGENK